MYATSTVKYRSNTDFIFRYCLSAFCVLKSAWHLCSNNHIAVLYKWLFIVRTLFYILLYNLSYLIWNNNYINLEITSMYNCKQLGPQDHKKMSHTFETKCKIY